MKGGRLRLPVRMSSCHQKTSPQRGLEESPSPFGNAGFAEGDNHHFRADFADHPPIDRNLLPFFPKEGPAPRQNQGFHPSTARVHHKIRFTHQSQSLPVDQIDQFLFGQFAPAHAHPPSAGRPEIPRHKPLCYTLLKGIREYIPRPKNRPAQTEKKKRSSSAGTEE